MALLTRHGVFTYALLNGLRRADRNGNGLMDRSELAGHVDALVITERALGLRQLPQMSLQGGYDFALAKRTEGLVSPAPAVATRHGQRM